MMNISLQDAQVLIVDDTPANLNVLRSVLEAEGYQVALANSGERALSIVPRLQPDLILLDVMMPGINGIETCRRLKASVQTQDIPIIFVTAKTETADIVEGFDVGGLDYIGKPFREKEVCARVHTILQNQFMKQEREKLYARQEKHMSHIQTILDNVSNGIATIDRQGLVRYCNPAAERLFGYQNNEIVGRPFAALMAADYTADCIHAFSRTAQKDDPLYGKPCEVVGRNSDGVHFEFDLSFTEIETDELLYIGVMHDISQHKAVERNLRTLSITDSLTQIANRRKFDETLGRILQQQLRTPLVLMIIDVDYFKRYNDTYGHQAGDDCLRRVAQTIQENADAYLVARYGGEEFAVVLADADLQIAQQRAELMRTGVQALDLQHAGSDVAPMITVSIGVAVMSPYAHRPMATFIKLADENLYHAKEQGRNRVIISTLE